MRSFTKRIITRNLVHNYNLLKEKAGGVLTVPVVKADAYGHSTTIVVQALVDEGVDYFAVAYSGEALMLGEEFPHIRILMMGIPEIFHIKKLIQAGITMAVSDWQTLELIVEMSRQLNMSPKIHLKIDTGMIRLGFRYELCQEIAEKCLRVQQVQFEGIMTHFACADSPEHPLNALQIQRFKKCLDVFKQNGITFKYQHMCNSAGVLNFPEAHYNMVRIGISLYGYTPGSDTEFDSRFKPVMEIDGKVSLVKPVKKGEGVSYGSTWNAPEDGYVIVIPIGYGDGYPRLLSNGGGKMIIGGRSYPICGRVCMDQLMVFSLEDTVRAGDRVLVLNSDRNLQITADDYADAAGTISYEILCDFLPRLPTMSVQESVGL